MGSLSQQSLLGLLQRVTQRVGKQAQIKVYSLCLTHRQTQ